MGAFSLEGVPLSQSGKLSTLRRVFRSEDQRERSVQGLSSLASGMSAVSEWGEQDLGQLADLEEEEEAGGLGQRGLSARTSRRSLLQARKSSQRPKPPEYV